MFGFKVYFNYAMWRLGLRSVLPARVVNRKKILESGDPMTELSPREFATELSYWGDEKCLVRSRVAQMLRAAQNALPAGLRLCILCGYRSIGQQRKEWARECAKQKKSHPDLPDAEIELLARKTVACPKSGFGPHQTGGAVDLALIDGRGRRLDMGGDYVGENSATFSKNITPAQHENRMILYNAMTGAGFANYPNEWWHFSYGDRAWAAYLRRPNAIYGRMQP